MKWCAGVAAVAACAVCGAMPAVAAAVPRLAFASSRAGNNYDVLTAGIDGSGLRVLTTGEHEYDTPAFSPDGSKIAYTRDWVVWVMNSDGTGQHQVGWPYTYRPRWSNDGRRLAFDGGAIFTSDPNGGDVRQLTSLAGGQVSQQPSFSPDGSQIVFVRSKTLWIVNSDGTGEHPIPSNIEGELPAWSPTGSVIVFQSNAQSPPYDTVGPGTDLYTVRPDGTGLRQLTHQREDDGAPAWSPDGRRIAFTSRRDWNYEIYVMNADGSGVTRVTHDSELDTAAPSDLNPSWDPRSANWAAPPAPAAVPAAPVLSVRCRKHQKARNGKIAIRVRATPGSVVTIRGRRILPRRFTAHGDEARRVRLALRRRYWRRPVVRIRVTARAPDGQRTSAIAVTALRRPAG